MKKVLFLPFLLMPSGHHQVAKALMDILNKYTDDVVCQKVDLLSYTNKSLEKIVSKTYLNWIRRSPKTYEWFYRKFYYTKAARIANKKWYNPFFIKKMEQLIEEEQPDLIVCTHGYPSYLLSELKQQGKITIPVMNVYTDFFVNSVWGKKGIDFHFVPSQQIKQSLIDDFQIPVRNIFVTGIPTHDEFSYKTSVNKPQSKRQKVLVAGGSGGLGNILGILREVKESSGFDYLVLCGKNENLYQEILSWNSTHISPIPYLSSRIEMNQLYDQVDAIITKPGGVTISEALRKNIPIFIHSALPGQEDINLHFLRQKELIIELDSEIPVEGQLATVLKDEIRMARLQEKIKSYQNGLDANDSESIVEIVQTALSQKSFHTAKEKSKKRFYLSALFQKGI